MQGSYAQRDSGRWRGAVAALTALLAAMPSIGWSMTCPVAHSASGPGVLKESPATIARLSRQLGQPDQSGARKLIADLRARHPTASDGEITNYVITAYCPAVNARSDLTETQKQAEMARFSSDVGKLLFSRTRR